MHTSTAGGESMFVSLDPYHSNFYQNVIMSLSDIDMIAYRHGYNVLRRLQWWPETDVGNRRTSAYLASLSPACLTHFGCDVAWMLSEI